MTSKPVLLIAAVAAAFALVSCSSGPAAPQKGTPAFSWQAAGETWAAGEYMKTMEHLAAVTKSENEFTARARAWQLVLTSGMAKGFMELADGWEYGARANKQNSMAFRKQVNMYRNFADRLALQFAENFQKFQAGPKEPNVTLAFHYPTGSTTPVPQIAKVSTGVLLQEAEMAEGQKKNLDRSVLLAVCNAVGAPEDIARAQAVLKAVPAQVPHDTFVLAMAKATWEQAQLYSRTKMDNPQRLEMLARNALDALKALPESKDGKDLIAKIEKETEKK